MGSSINYPLNVCVAVGGTYLIFKSELQKSSNIIGIFSID